MVKIEEKNTHGSRFLNGNRDDLLHRLSLPEDLIIEILLRLPVRSLLQLYCVCKSWKTLISDPRFAKRHLKSLTMNPSITNLQFFFGNGFGRIVSVPVKPLMEKPSEPTKVVEFRMEQYRFHVLGSSNGLLCLLHMDKGYVRLWNPSTRFKSTESPSVASLFNKWWVSTYGFGYDHVNDKYKVLLDVRPLGDSSYNENARLYTFGENSWTIIQNFPCVYAKSIGKFVSGTLNWVIVRRVGDYKQTTILSFDLVKETHTEILLPINQNQDGWRNCEPNLGVLDNCLCLSFDIDTHWVLWLMKEYGVADSWTRLIMIRAEDLREVEGPLFFIDALFLFGNSIVLLRTINKFVLYNLNNGTIDIPLISTLIMRYQYLYVETLVSPQL